MRRPRIYHGTYVLEHANRRIANALISQCRPAPGVTMLATTMLAVQRTAAVCGWYPSPEHPPILSEGLAPGYSVTLAYVTPTGRAIVATHNHGRPVVILATVRGSGSTPNDKDGNPGDLPGW